MRTLTESKVRLWLIAVIILIVFVNAYGAYQYVRELQRQTYFTNVSADFENDYADLKLKDRVAD